MGNRRQSRESALQALYGLDFHNNWDKDRIHFILEEFGVQKDAKGLRRHLSKRCLR